MYTILQTAITWLLLLVLGLPTAYLILTLLAGLLGALGDAEASRVLQRVNIAVSAAWLIAVVGLIVVVALNAVRNPGPLHDEIEEPPM